jgi:hypothetical protein
MDIIETVKFWWRVKKANRKLLKQAKKADRTPYETTVEDVENWIRTNPFGVTREELNVSHMTRVTAPPVTTFKEFEHGNR